MSRCWVACLLLLAACTTASNHAVAVVSSPPSSTPTASPASTPIPTPTPSPNPRATPLPSPSARVSSTLLFAALEWNPTNAAAPATLAILGLDGHERARTTVAAPTGWGIGCLGTLPPTVAYVAAGKVFYADAGGEIRTLSPAGQVAPVTTFPTTGRQMLNYAVSPDGRQLLATVLTEPAVVSKDALCSRSPASGYSGDFTLSAYSARAGESAHLLYSETVPLRDGEPFPCILKLVGWDSLGPIGISPACLGPTGGPVRYFGGPPVRVDPTTGRVSGPIADPGACRVEDVAPSGDYVCNPIVPGMAPTWTGDISVRRPDGSQIWSLKSPPADSYDYDFLSPDELHVLSQTSAGVVLGKDGTSVPLADVSYVAGWFDSSTVAVYDAAGNFGYIALGAPESVVDLGGTGWQFVGTVRN